MAGTIENTPHDEIQWRRPEVVAYWGGVRADTGNLDAPASEISPAQLLSSAPDIQGISLFRLYNQERTSLGSSATRSPDVGDVSQQGGL